MNRRTRFWLSPVRLVFVALAALPGLVPAVSGAEEARLPEDSGPHPWVKLTDRADVGIDGRGPEGSIRVMVTDVYVPTTTGPWPVVVFSHGLCDTKANYLNWGPVLASRGFVALVPNRRTAVEGLVPEREATVSECLAQDPRINSEDLLRVLQWARDESEKPGSQLYRKVDIRRSAIVGHSLGGTFAALAAARASNPSYFQDTDPVDYSEIRLRAVVLLDPGRILTEPDHWKPESAARSIATPTAVIAGRERAPAPDPANPSPSDPFQPVVCEDAQELRCLLVPRATFAALPSKTARLGLEVVGATHFEPADPDTVDRPPNSDRQRWFKRYTMAWLEVWLACDDSAMSYLNGTAAHSDEQSGRIAMFSGSSSFTRGELQASC